jgi:hypothetical protein
LSFIPTNLDVSVQKIFQHPPDHQTAWLLTTHRSSVASRSVVSPFVSPFVSPLVAPRSAESPLVASHSRVPPSVHSSPLEVLVTTSGSRGKMERAIGAVRRAIPGRSKGCDKENHVPILGRMTNSMTRQIAATVGTRNTR